MPQVALPRDRASLESAAAVALEFGRLLMQAGGSAGAIEHVIAQVGGAFGAERTDVRVGFASITATIAFGSRKVTRMRKVGPVSVNQVLHQAISATAARIEQGDVAPSDAEAELRRVVRTCPSYPRWVVAVSVGAACAAFGRLLGADWAGVGPITLSAALVQFVRPLFAARHVNAFVSTAVFACMGSLLCGVGARSLGSETVARDMVATVLLLVPGVPALNAQLDILQGRPTLGSARAVWVLVMLIFMSAGLWIALGVLREGR